MRWKPIFAAGLLLTGLIGFGETEVASAQKPPAHPIPYASIGTVHYDGPNRQPAYDLKGAVIRIGLLAPLHGPQKTEGLAIVRAAQVALRNATRQPLAGGRKLALAIADESVPPWGALGDEIIRMVLRQKVIAIVTSADAVSAHLSEQIGNKIGVPVLTLSSDPTTTEINMPWIFRLGPSDTAQAHMFAGNIYRARGLRRVLVVAARNHDGRVGSTAFVKSAHELGEPPPATLFVDSFQPSLASLLSGIRAHSPEAIVFWTSPQDVSSLVPPLREAGIHVPIYLCQEATQQGSGLTFPLDRMGSQQHLQPNGIWTVIPPGWGDSVEQKFARRYQTETGMPPTPIAAEAYDAITLIVKSLRQAGPNRARLRDRLATVHHYLGASGRIRFDDQGNDQAAFQLVRLQGPKALMQRPRP